MAKISGLPVVAAPNGDETVVVLKNGQSMAVKLSALIAAGLSPYAPAGAPRLTAVENELAQLDGRNLVPVPLFPSIADRPFGMPAGTLITYLDGANPASAFTIAPNDGRVSIVVVNGRVGLYVGATASAVGSQVYAVTETNAVRGLSCTSSITVNTLPGAYATFTAADGVTLPAYVSDSGHAWSLHPNSAGALAIVKGGKLQPSAAATQLYVSAFVPTSSSFEAGMTFSRPVAGGTDGYVALRLDPAALTYYAVGFDTTQPGWRVIKVVGGTAMNTGIVQTSADSTTIRQGLVDTNWWLQPLLGREFKVVGRVVDNALGQPVVTLYVNDVKVLEYTDTTANAITATNNPNAKRAGMRVTNGANSSTIGFQYDDWFARDLAATKPVTIDIACDRRIRQRVGTAGTMDLSGTYNTVEPAAVRVRFKDPFTGFCGKEWSHVNVSKLGGGIWAGTVAGVPKGYWNVAVQLLDAFGAVLCSVDTRIRVGIGQLIPTAGSSSMHHLFDNYGRYGLVHPSLAMTVDGNVFYASSVGSGSIILANALYRALGEPIGLIDKGVTGSLTEEWSAPASPYRAAFVAAVKAAGVTAPVIFHLAPTPSNMANRDPATTKATLETIFASIRAESGLPDLKVLVDQSQWDYASGGYPRPDKVDTAENRANQNQIVLAERQAEQAVSAEPYNYITPSSLDLTIENDKKHIDELPTPTFVTRLAARLLGIINGSRPMYGPRFTTMTRISNTQKRLNAVHSSGSSLVLRTPGAMATGFAIFTSDPTLGQTVPSLEVTNAVIDGTDGIIVTHADDGGAPVWCGYQQAAGPDGPLSTPGQATSGLINPVYDNIQLTYVSMTVVATGEKMTSTFGMLAHPTATYLVA